MTKFAFVAAERANHAVATLCRVVGASVALEGGTFANVDVPPAVAAALAAGRPGRTRDVPVLRELAELGLLRA